MKKRILILKILIAFFFLSSLFFGYKIILWNIDNKNTDKQINDILKVVEFSSDVSSNESNVDFLNVNFDDIRETNSEVVGWIAVPGTNINYPFLQHKDNNYYLTHSFDKSYNSAGWVFLDYRNNIDSLNSNNIIYAHGRVDGTMFGSLKNTLNKDWFDNNSHDLQITTPFNCYIFKIFSVYHVKTTNDYTKVSFSDDLEFGEFINLIKNRSIYDFDTDVSVNDNIVTLSTCYNNSEKMVVHAKLTQVKKRY